MIIKNPSDQIVEITIKDKVYTVGSNDEVEVSTEVAEHWITVHEFLQIVESPATEVESVEETAETPEATEEVSEDTPAEVEVEEKVEEAVEEKEEKPKAKRSSKKSK